MIRSFPKIFAIGTEYIKDVFRDEVEITEKVDGSQFAFGVIDGEFYMRSKGKQIFPEAPEKMFIKACDYVYSIQEKLPNNIVYYCEYLQSSKHNVLQYKRHPKNYLLLFGVSDNMGKFVSDYESIKTYAEEIDIETVPLIYHGKIEDAQNLLKLLENESILGDTKIEGIVVKNYSQPFLLGGQPIPIMMGKFVSEKFKEVHRTKWSGEFTSKGKWVTFMESFRTEARWNKAVQHLNERGELENAPRDIGKLLKEVNLDIIEEEKENIKEFLWKEFGKAVLRKSTAGLPEWYKEKLLKNGFEG
jgi:hypothetical protein